MGEQTASMKSMKLYDQVERIHNELEALGIDRDAPLAVEDLTPFDQYHYCGTEAVDDAIATLAIDDHSRVLEIGSGIGGPARYTAHRTGCALTALELQPDLDGTARELTQRCKLDTRITHVCGNVLDGTPEASAYDAIMSFLVFLHIPDRARLMQVCHAGLAPGGRIFIEDFTALSEPDDTDRATLRDKIQCPYLPDAVRYVADLEDAGFIDIEAHDMTDPWQRFTAERLAAFRARRPRHVELHGEAMTQGLEEFYTAAADLYDRRIIGGIRVSARKPG